MSPRYKSKKKIPSASKTTPSLPVLHPHAAGIDIGAREIYVAVPPDHDPKPVRACATFTEDLHALRDWLKACGVTSVAMESTGVYWIPLFQILEAAGLEVCLVNARHCKNLPGRKTDVQDCQWLQYLHSVGLLRGSFRPPETVCAVRSLLRHRDGLVRAAATCVHRLHKALTQMNLQLQHVIADVTGVTGLAILEALLTGQRDPVALAQLKDRRIRASTDTIAKSLRGDWRAEHLFTLRQTLGTWKHYQGQITACDEEIARLLQGFTAKVDVAAQPLPARTSTHKSPQKNEPRFAARQELYRTCGVDLTQVPGIQSGTALVLLAELGPDFAERFPTARHFGSWLGLCPDITKTAELLHGQEKQVHADAGYPGVEKRMEIVALERKIDWQIAGKRWQIKSMVEGAEKEAIKAVEKAKASVRAFVEHPFHIVKNLFRHRKVRYQGLAKNGHQLYTLFGLANVRIGGRTATT